MQYKLEVNVTPKTATLKIDDETKTLDADGKLTMDVDFDTELNLVTELTGFVKDEQKVTIKAEDNKVDINLAKAKVSKCNKNFFICFNC